MRSPDSFLFALVLALAGGNLAFTFHRSGIPVDLTGRVDRIEVRGEKHPGVDDVHLVTIDGRVVHLDAEVARMLRKGDGIEKPAWSATLKTPRGEQRLHVSRDFERMAIAMPLLIGLALLLLRWPGVRRSLAR